MGIRTRSKDTIWSRSFVKILTVNFIISMGQFMMNTLVPKFTLSLGATETIVGVVSSVFAFAALLIRPVAGPAMDYFRKGRLLSAALGLVILAFVGYACAGSVAVIMAARILQGIGVGVAVPLAVAIVSNTLPAEKITSGISIYMLGSAIATAIGPTVGLKLSALVGYPLTFLLAAGLLTVCLILCLLLKTELPVRTQRYRISLKNIIVPEVIRPTLVIFFMTMAYSSINFFMAIYGGSRGVEDIGLFFTVYAVCLFISRPLGGRIADRYGSGKVIIPGIALFALSFVLISFSKTLPMFLLDGAVCAFGYGICMPTLQALSMSIVPKERRGAAGNTNYIGIDLGSMIGPVAAGFVINDVQSRLGNEAVGYAEMYRLMILPVLAALVIFILTKKKILVR